MVKDSTIGYAFKSKDIELTLLRLVVNEEFPCPNSCTKVERIEECLAEGYKVVRSKEHCFIVCTTLLVSIKNISNNTVEIWDKDGVYVRSVPLWTLIDEQGNMHQCNMNFLCHTVREILERAGLVEEGKVFPRVWKKFLFVFPAMREGARISEIIYEHNAYRDEKPRKIFRIDITSEMALELSQQPLLEK